MNSVFHYSNSGANKSAGQKCFKISSGFIRSGFMADEYLKNALDNIVEGLESYLNNFIQLRKEPLRQYRIEETSSSKLGW